MEKLSKIRDILKIVETNISREEFLMYFKKVLDIVNESKKRIEAEMFKLKSIDKEIINSLDNYSKQAIEEFKQSAEIKIDKKLEDITNKVNSIQNGKDADELAIIESVKNQIYIPTIEELKDDLPKMGLQVRDALELLQGEERLDISAIKDLKMILDEIRQTKSLGGGGGGGFSAISYNIHILDPYTPSGVINGVNTDFVLSHKPSPSTSLKVYRNGALQQLNPAGTTDGDYSLSGLTITFNTAVAVGEIILVEHRI